MVLKFVLRCCCKVDLSWSIHDVEFPHGSYTYLQFATLWPTFFCCMLPKLTRAQALSCVVVLFCRSWLKHALLDCHALKEAAWECTARLNFCLGSVKYGPLQFICSPSLLSGLLNSKHSLKHFEMFTYQNELLGLKLVNGMMDHLIPLSINQGSQIQLTLEWNIRMGWYDCWC